ncbi:MAG: hypothetical protein ACI87W_002766 [Halieaceae bacterium]|jgi:hypothetical protein
MSVETVGIGGLILLIASVWTIIKTIQSNTSTAKKVIWLVVILLLPILGLILWFFCLGGANRRRNTGQENIKGSCLFSHPALQG